MSKYIDVKDYTTDRTVTLCMNGNGTLTLLGALPHNSQIGIDEHNLKKLKKFIEIELNHCKTQKLIENDKKLKEMDGKK